MINTIVNPATGPTRAGPADSPSILPSPLTTNAALRHVPLQGIPSDAFFYACADAALARLARLLRAAEPAPDAASYPTHPDGSNCGAGCGGSAPAGLTPFGGYAGELL